MDASLECRPAKSGPPLIERRPRLPHVLDATPAFFALDAPFARSFGRLGRAARRRRRGGAANEIDEAVEGIVAVAPLGAMALRDDDEDALAREPRAGEPLEPGPDVARQRWRAAHIETQLHRGRQLVDVLAAWTRGAHEAFVDFALVNGQP